MTNAQLAALERNLVARIRSLLQLSSGKFTSIRWRARSPDLDFMQSYAWVIRISRSATDVRTQVTTVEVCCAYGTLDQCFPTNGIYGRSERNLSKYSLEFLR